jgi:pyruvate, orthophosphate dikinase
VFTVTPFETIDADGVGRLVKIAAEEGRKNQARPQARRLR